jgi:hypothetical protein
MKLAYMRTMTGMTDEQLIALDPSLAPVKEDTQEIDIKQSKVNRLTKEIQQFESGSVMQSQRNVVKEGKTLKGFVPYTIPDNIGWFPPSLLSMMQRQTMGENGEYYTGDMYKPGMKLLGRSRFIEALVMGEEAASLNKDLYDMQQKHHLEGGGDAPDFTPPADYKAPSEVKDTTRSLNMEAGFNESSISLEELKKRELAKLKNDMDLNLDSNTKKIENVNEKALEDDKNNKPVIIYKEGDVVGPPQANIDTSGNQNIESPGMNIVAAFDQGDHGERRWSYHGFV